ncbi:MAG: hypothetical protein M3P33_02650, partial [bacterium]|nr:hypothetical protein [bacterium]
MPAFGKSGLPASTAGEYPPTAHPSVAATLTQIGWFVGNECIVVENPVTFVLYIHLPLMNAYSTTNLPTPSYGAQLTNILSGLLLLVLNITGFALTPVETQTAGGFVVELELELEVVDVQVGT